MKYLFAVCFCLCLIAVLTPAASATVTTYTYDSGSGAQYWGTFSNITVYNIQTYYPYMLDFYMNSTYGGGSAPFSMDNIATPVSTSFTAAVGATPVGAGTITWTNYSTSFGKLSMEFSSFDPGVLTGTQVVKLTYDNANLAHLTAAGDSAFASPGVGAAIPAALTAVAGGGQNYRGIYTLGYGGAPVVTSNFTATPTSGPATLYVFFEDTSTNATSWNWSITPTTGVTGYIGSTQDHFAYFATPGNYTVSHGATSVYGSDIETKINYITIYNSTSDYVTSGFVAMDAPRWVQLAGAAINLLDVENNSWKNTSSSATGYETITTLSNHTINAYSSMLGYGDASLLSQPASDDSFYILRMYPIGYSNVSAGSVTLYVTIFGSDIPNGRLSGATVNIAYELSGGQHSDYRITDASGIAQFVVPNQTTIYVYAEKAGYTRGGTTVASGNGNGGNASVYSDVTLQRAYVTTVPTPTTLPGGGTPTATPTTVDPYPCDADHPENCERKQTDMANDLIEWGPDLMLLFIMATIIGVIKMMGK